MTTFTIKFENSIKNGIAYRRFCCAESDKGHWISDQNTINGKRSVDADEYAVAIPMWYKSLGEVNVVFQERLYNQSK
jgi:hypothetical protein